MLHADGDKFTAPYSATPASRRTWENLQVIPVPCTARAGDQDHIIVAVVEHRRNHYVEQSVGVFQFPPAALPWRVRA